MRLDELVWWIGETAKVYRFIKGEDPLDDTAD